MSEQERIKAAEQAVYQANRTFQALRGVAFMLGQTEGRGPSEWTGEPLEDLGALLDVLAERGYEHTEAGLEELQGIRQDKLRATA